MTSPGHRATLQDVSKKAGTSTATASRVLSNNGYPVSDALRQSILQAAQSLDYSPNLVGKLLKQNISHDIGIIVPNITNPFYAQLLMGVEMEARRQDFSVLLCNSFGDVETERKYASTLQQKRVAGLIISSVSEHHGFLDKMQRQGLQIVAFDQGVDSCVSHRVGFDFLRGGMVATEHLISLGHRKIAFLSTSLIRRSRREQFEGCRLAMMKHQIPFPDSNLLISSGKAQPGLFVEELEIGRQLAAQFMSLSDRPTAIIAVNDILAVSIMQSLLQAGFRVPQDVSVIGFDDLELSALMIPPLTTIRLPAREMGRMASQILIARLLRDTASGLENRDREPPTVVTIESQLIIRQSTAEPL